jgi:hypothetical protein
MDGDKSRDRCGREEVKGSMDNDNSGSSNDNGNKTTSLNSETLSWIES